MHRYLYLVKVLHDQLSIFHYKQMLPDVGTLYSIMHMALATKKEFTRVPSYSCKLGADFDGKLTYKHSEV